MSRPSILLLPLVLLLGLSTACAPADDEAVGDGPRKLAGAASGKADDVTQGAGWSEQARLVADRSSLGAAFAARGYAPPAGTRLHVARVVDGVEQPAFEMYSLGDTAFEYSADRYWPASTVKLLAAVGALQTLAGYGLTGAAEVSFEDDDGSYDGSVRALYEAAIEVSSNTAYNRLMLIAGFDELNDEQLIPETGFPTTVLQRRFTHPTPSADLRTSPEIAYVEIQGGGAERSGTIPERSGTGEHAECPREGNCVTLFELAEGLRRVTLHNELPIIDRFSLAPSDVDGLQASLLQAPSRMQEGAAAALGADIVVYNKTGSVAGDERLDHALIVEPTTGRRWLIAMSMPYDATSDAMSSELAWQVLTALEGMLDQPLPMQRDAGIAVDAWIESGTVSLEADADTLEAWVDGAPVAVEHGVVAFDFSAGSYLLSVRATSDDQPLGYRSFQVDAT